MSSFLSRLKSNASTTSPTTGSTPAKKAVQNTTPLTPIEKLLEGAGPLRKDGSDKFFGMHNPSNTCYCNSVLQCLYFSEPFRDQVIKFPVGTPAEIAANLNNLSAQINDSLVPEIQAKSSAELSPNAPLKKSASTPTSPVAKEENKESFDYQKKQALMNGPQIKLETSNFSAYGMTESLFTGLKDLFGAIIAHKSRTGVVIPAKFLEVLRRNYEAYRSPMHQDAHEFLNLLLNEVVEQVEDFSKKAKEISEPQQTSKNGSSDPPDQTLAKDKAAQTNTSWVHELFEGTLTSETKCLTCETKSQRDEVFLDLSVDLEEHSSVTSCLRRFSEEEMLCERNKFHCDKCGGLQEAEKRMKIKRLPRILALHLKRFKYTEEMDRLFKLFHRVVFPFHLRLLNTSDDAEDPDRLYELYAIIVHLGSTPFHGHYVSIIKTKDRGWLLFDDELVLPVDANYVRNYFGGDPRNPACAYVLFYQETTEEAVQEEYFTEDAVIVPELNTVTSELATSKPKPDDPASLDAANPTSSLDDREPFASLGEAVKVPFIRTPTAPQQEVKEGEIEHVNINNNRRTFDGTEFERGLLNTDETDQTDKAAHEERAIPKEPTGKPGALRTAKSGSLNRFRHSSMSLRGKPKFWSSKEKDKGDANHAVVLDQTDVPPAQQEEVAVEKPKSRFSLGRKKSAMLS